MKFVGTYTYVVVSWVALIGIFFLFAVQTNSVNVIMVIFLLIVPSLLNLPLLFKGLNDATNTFQLITICIDVLIFILAIITAIFNDTYISYVRWGIGILSLVGISVMTVVLVKRHV
ncbi:MAG: hypothetical protein ACRCZW_13240 [Lactobacillaceae bacterium]